MTETSAGDAGTGEDAPVPDDQPEPVVEETGEIVLPPGAEPVEVHPPVAERARLASWALGIAIVGLGVSFFVGWGFPLGLAAIVVAIVALRRPWESRFVAIWALALGVLSVIYSAGWLVFAAIESTAG
ncbi:hypothetical protein [Microbacterium mangrovi]|uniref:hypothetical protein n=1 Tax=Microbacterium mangrovi TaxID=1348253 RepID=UPI0006918FAD|nr:hypothetical protein [Microbacterium mangrovi]